METYRERQGIRLTYFSIAAKTGISVNTLQSLAARNGYNTRLSTIEKLCRLFECSPGELLVIEDAGAEQNEDQ